MWVHEGRMDKGARRIIYVNRRILKTESVDPKGEECSREVETDGQNIQIGNSKASTAEKEVYLRAGVFITVPILERATSYSFILFPQTHTCTQPHM